MMLTVSHCIFQIFISVRNVINRRFMCLFPAMLASKLCHRPFKTSPRQKTSEHKYLALSRAWQRFRLLALAASSQLADVSCFIDHDNQPDAHKTNTDTCQKSRYGIYGRKLVYFRQRCVLRPLFPSLFPIPQPALSISTLTVSQSFQSTEETACQRQLALRAVAS